MIKGLIKKRLLKTLITLQMYPHILYTFNSLKVYEFQQLLKDIPFSQNETLLDIGCGLGLQTLLLGKRAKTVIGVDISEDSINHAKNMGQLFTGRIDSRFYCQKVEEAEFNPEYFDKVFSFCVIEHIPNYEEVFREIYRILKKQGMFIFSVDSLDSLIEKEINLKQIHQEKCSVYHYFHAEELKSLLGEIGFRKIKVSPACQSEFAKQLFTEGIRNDFQYHRLAIFWKYYFLRYNEILYSKKHLSAKDEAGLFLFAKCEK
jgi:2-polyprenyl-3-methyl-5-hydroxy-6-metoxy-1,4-benzoquinol methylase